MKSPLPLLLSLASTLYSLADGACDVAMASTSMQPLTDQQLNLYGLTDPCTITCTAGYTGDFCLNQTVLYTSLPMGPWNQPGYYASSGLLRTMSLAINDISYVQYTKQDSQLIGILKPALASSRVVVIALYSRIIAAVMTPPPGGTFDSLIMRSGTVYLGRTLLVSGSDTFSVVSLSSTYVATPLVSLAAKSTLLEVFVDKGTVTTFAYNSIDKVIRTYYPSGTRQEWTSLANVIGLACGADGPAVVYASTVTSIFRVTVAGSVLLRDTGSTIYCLTGLSALNVLLYKTSTVMYQHNLATNTYNSIPLGIPDSGIKRTCSLDVSELNNQILIVQEGVIRTLEAVQQLCGYGLTSTALLANSQSACTPCPSPPANAYWIEGSAVCEWTCKAEFSRVGSRCVAQVVVPCPALYVADTRTPGVCLPSVLPWAGQGKYVSSVQYAVTSLSLPSGGTPYVVATVSPSILVATSAGSTDWYVSRDSGSSWTQTSIGFFSEPPCSLSAVNRYYYMSSRGDGLLWVAFYVPNTQNQHCLWLMNAASVVAGQNTLQITRAWSLRNSLCDVTGDANFVYMYLCGTHFLSYARVEKGSVMLPLAGAVRQGYADGSLLAALFRLPTSMVLYDSRLYVTDAGNCVIRELDLLRDAVRTVAGTPALCQRQDDGEQRAALASPNNLTYTPYAGFFLFVDKLPGEPIAVLRQFHVPTCTVRTVRALPSNYFNDILAVAGGVLIRAERNLQLLAATTISCPAGTSTLEGNALSLSGCQSCGYGFYSNPLTGACKNCSTLTCNTPGQLVVPCQADADTRCGACTNKPSLANTQYIGASSVTGTADGGGDCPWAYTSPCPVGFYLNNSLCVSCPVWSTTTTTGREAITQCVCLGTGTWVNGICVIPAIFGADSASLRYFPLLPACLNYASTDSAGGVCPCQPGEYIQQINPKICSPCQAGSYSPMGIKCLPCPARTESSFDKITCTCAAGLYDAGGVAEGLPTCVCGPGKAFSSSPLQCTACGENTFNNAVIDSESALTASTCALCEQGTFSGSGASECTLCPFGTYRLPDSTEGCQSCPTGSYAPDATYESCIVCSERCEYGMKEVVCPTDANLLTCSDCPEEVPPNAYRNGGRDCATSCNAGYYERDGACVECSVFDAQSCARGNLHVPCSAYMDAACVACVNASMPLNYAVWKYSPLAEGGPNARCDWECETGYVPLGTSLPEGVQSAWQCLLAGAWSVWDIFTI